MQGKSSSTNIKVFCRFRPFNKQELQNSAQKIHRIASNKQLIIKDPNRNQQISFMFDNLFDCETTQQQIYHNIGMPILNNILDGFNGTIMAYGQTSSGKTHTMQGHDINDKQHKGLIPRIIENLFSAIEKSPENQEFKLKVSIFQLYMEKIRDLLDLSKSDLKIRQNKHSGPYVEQLTQAYISDKVQLYKLIFLGQKNRATCTTNMNAVSSRSHMIFLLTLNQQNLETSQAKTSKLFLIDLAGSQKVSKTGAGGKVLEQAKKINLSLTSLGMVIKSLSEGQTHVPYRDSKLTRIIKDSLGGNSRTSLIVACSPHEMHIAETISTLRFGENAQKIKNKPKINRQLTVPELMKKIEQIQAKLEEKDEWIKILQNYIKKQLNSPLPKHDKKINNLKNQEQKQSAEDKLISEEIISQIEQKIIEKKQLQQRKKQSKIVPQINLLKPLKAQLIQGSKIVEQKIEKQEHFENESKDEQDSQVEGEQQEWKQTKISEQISKQREDKDNQRKQELSIYNYEYISSLQTELESYKQNLQSELNKFYQLKKQYNSLNQNLKSLIEENISYQEKEKQYEHRLSEEKEDVIKKFRKNCGFIFGEILEFANLCNNSNTGGTNMTDKNMSSKVVTSIGKNCHEKIKHLINTKGKCLCFEGQNIDFFDYWKSQKEIINKKMQEVIEKSMNMQKKLEKKQQKSMTQIDNSQQKQRQKDKDNERERERQRDKQRNIQQNRKLMQMEEKLDSLYNQYQQMLALQTNWKVQCQLYQRKLKIKQQKITQLRAMLEDIQEQMELMGQDNDQTMSVNTKIVKPLKGGFLFR